MKGTAAAAEASQLHGACDTLACRQCTPTGCSTAAHQRRYASARNRPQCAGRARWRALARAQKGQVLIVPPLRSESRPQPRVQDSSGAQTAACTHCATGARPGRSPKPARDAVTVTARVCYARKSAQRSNSAATRRHGANSVAGAFAFMTRRERQSAVNGEGPAGAHSARTQTCAPHLLQRRAPVAPARVD
jgi:hypothetical protein